MNAIYNSNINLQNNNEPPVVSVIIPTYNRCNKVVEAIDSALNQTVDDIEVIVVDDASTDETENTIKALTDPRIKYIRHTNNMGGAEARNTGIRNACGDYIAFLDSDDKWMSDKLTKQLSLLEQSNQDVSMVYCWMIRRKNNIKQELKLGFKNDCYDELLKQGSGICTSTFVVKREYINLIDGFNSTLPSFQDFDFLLRIAKISRIDLVKEFLVVYDLQSESISFNMKAKAEGLLKIIECYKEDILQLNVMDKYLFRLGMYYMLSGLKRDGWKCWLKTLKSNPLHFKCYKHLIASLIGTQVYSKLLRFNTRIKSS